MSLLMPSRPIVINPDLAYSIGLNEAIALQQVNYWLQETNSGLERDGVRWIYNTTEQWLEQFPFWSEVHAEAHIHPPEEPGRAQS
jgi:hypothetical protein